VDAEPKYGLCVTGRVDPRRILIKGGLRPGQQVFLSKPLGTGVIATAAKNDKCEAAVLDGAVQSMLRLNRVAAEVAQEAGAGGATDITGFGLLGHLRNIVRGSGVGARIELARLPLLPDAKLHLRAGLCPAGSKANRAFVADLVRWSDGAPLAAEPDDSERELLASLACDAQTSGGLLLCVPAARAAACVAELRDAGLPAAAIGEVCELSARPIELA
jgi:selenide,water dikinase